MIICKLCGTANTPDSTVCTSCGSSLLKVEGNGSSLNSSNEIFSNKTDNKSVKPYDNYANEIYSSHSSHDAAQQKKLFEKIRKQEEALGDITKDEEFIPQKAKPVNVNNSSPKSDAAQNGKSKSKPPSSKNHTIPQRIIESVDKQVLQQKMKPTVVANESDVSDDEKVELTSSKVIEEIHEKHEQTMKLRKLKEERQKQGKKKKTNQNVNSEIPQKQINEPVKKKNTDINVSSEIPQKQINEPVKKKNTNTNVNSEIPQRLTDKPIKKKKTNTNVNSEIPQRLTDKPGKKKNTDTNINSEIPQRLTDKPIKKKKTDTNVYSEISQAQTDKPIKKKKTAQSADRKVSKKQNCKPGKKKKKSLNYNFTSEDIESNKYYAALSYLGVLFLIPLIKRKNSDFCRAHARQGIVLFIVTLLIYAITFAAIVGLRTLLVWTLGLPYKFYTAALLIMAAIMLFAVYIPVYKGVIAALEGKFKRLPLIGKIVK